MENNNFLANAKVVKLPSKDEEKEAKNLSGGAASDRNDKTPKNPVAKKTEERSNEKNFSPQKKEERNPDPQQIKKVAAPIKGKKPVKRVKRLKKKTIEPIIEKRLHKVIEDKINENLIFVNKEEYKMLLKNAEHLSKENEKLKEENSILIKKIKEEESKNQTTLPRGTMPLNMDENIEKVSVTNYTLTSKETGEIFEIKKKSKLGQDNSFADILVINPTVSRKHAELVIRENKLYVKDLGSTNHTYINEQKVIDNAETEVKHNQVLKFANVEFIVTETK